MENKEKSLPSTSINWYPGHMEKTKREIKKILPLVDFILELVDARIPNSSKLVGIDEIVQNKPVLYVMTKKDLCDMEETNKWVEYYKNDNKNVVLVDLKTKSDYKLLISKIDEFANQINKKRLEKGLKPKNIRGLVIGIPNVGKSTLINMLAGSNVAKVGNTPGFTKSLSWLKAGKTLLLDSPGILWPKFESDEVALNLASMSAIKIEVLEPSQVAVHILEKLNAYYKDKMKNRYGLEKLSDDYTLNYDIIGKTLGAVTKGGQIDYDRVNLAIINDIKQERIKGITFDRM